MRRIIAFYEGTGTDAAGRSFEDVLSLSDDQLETIHDWVQWVFPLPEWSRAQPQSPALTADDVVAFKSTFLRAQVLRATIRVQEFFARTTRWRRSRDHNHLRITRILRFLTLIGEHGAAMNLYEFVKEHVQGLPLNTLWYWTEALCESPAWLPQATTHDP